MIDRIALFSSLGPNWFIGFEKLFLRAPSSEREYRAGLVILLSSRATTDALFSS